MTEKNTSQDEPRDNFETPTPSHGGKSLGILFLIAICAALTYYSFPKDKSPGASPAASAQPIPDAPPSLNAPSESDWPTAPRSTTIDASFPATFSARMAERQAMADYVRDNPNYQVTDIPTLLALNAVPRHEYVPEEITTQAYYDTPLPIANGQLISQPYIVAKMTSELHLKATSKVLEIGTGSGYQGSVLAHITPNVYSIEIIKPLAEAAADRLHRLGYQLHLRIGDGFSGWPDAAPFDAIIVTCAAGQVPPPLIAQLAPGGRMMIPVGQPFSTQWLMLIEKDMDGAIHSSSLEVVKFVPLLQKDPTANGK